MWSLSHSRSRISMFTTLRTSPGEPYLAKKGRLFPAHVLVGGKNGCRDGKVDGRLHNLDAPCHVHIDVPIEEGNAEALFQHGDEYE